MIDPLPPPDAPLVPEYVSPEAWAGVLLRLSEGAPTLRRACAGYNVRPWQVLKQAEVSDRHAQQLAAATACGVEALHDEMCNTEERLLYPARAKALGGPVHPAAASTALQNMRWRAERLDRKKWATKVEVEGKIDHTLTVQVVRFTNAGEAERDAIDGQAA